MMCELLFSRKNRKNITNLLSTESVYSMVSAKNKNRIDFSRQYFVM